MEPQLPLEPVHSDISDSEESEVDPDELLRHMKEALQRKQGGPRLEAIDLNVVLTGGASGERTRKRRSSSLGDLDDKYKAVLGLHVGGKASKRFQKQLALAHDDPDHSYTEGTNILVVPKDREEDVPEPVVKLTPQTIKDSLRTGIHPVQQQQQQPELKRVPLTQTDGQEDMEDDSEQRVTFSADTLDNGTTVKEQHMSDRAVFTTVGDSRLARQVSMDDLSLDQKDMLRALSMKLKRNARAEKKMSKREREAKEVALHKASKATHMGRMNHKREARRNMASKRAKSASGQGARASAPVVKRTDMLATFRAPKKKKRKAGKATTTK